MPAGVVRRQGLVAVTAALLAAGLAGCGASSGSGDKAGGASASDWSSHAALVAAAKKEGALSVLTSFTEPSYTAIKDGFEAKYPFLEGHVKITEETGDDETRILLELQSGQNDTDVLHMNFDQYDDFLPYVDKHDLLALTDGGVLDITPEMINPDHPNTLAVGSGIAAITYNKKQLSEDQLPDTWEDLLAPQFKGRKFLIDIEPTNMGVLGSVWGEDKLREYATALGAQKPIFVRGDTASITLLAAGEYSLHAFSNYHSAFRVQQESPDTVGIKVLEPVPVRLTQIESIRKGAAHPAAAALFLEYTASPEVQKILDENEPRQSSIYSPESSLHDLISGKETAVAGWKEFKNEDQWAALISEAWGFPSAEIEK
jgi:iron(III) transport system substrate-binding protein